MSVTVKLMSGDVFHIKIFDGFNMKNLKNKILDILNQNQESNILFYDSDNNSIKYNDEDIVKNKSHFNIIIQQLFSDEYLKDWEESDNAIEYDPEIDCDGDEYWN